MLKPFLKKEYASLCSSVVSSLLVGDELQVAAIRASNRITNTAIDPERGSVSTRGAPSARICDPEMLIEKPFFYKILYPRWTNKATPCNRNHGEGEQEVLIPSQMVNRLNSLEVSEFMAFLPSLKKHLLQQIALFEGGRIRKYFSHWQEITTDSEVIDMVSGTPIEFQSKAAQTCPKKAKISCKFLSQECTTIQTEVSNLNS